MHPPVSFLLAPLWPLQKVPASFVLPPCQVLPVGMSSCRVTKVYSPTSHGPLYPPCAIQLKRSHPVRTGVLMELCLLLVSCLRYEGRATPQSYHFTLNSRVDSTMAGAHEPKEESSLSLLWVAGLTHEHGAAPTFAVATPSSAAVPVPQRSPQDSGGLRAIRIRPSERKSQLSVALKQSPTHRGFSHLPEGHVHTPLRHRARPSQHCPAKGGHIHRDLLPSLRPAGCLLSTHGSVRDSARGGQHNQRAN